MPVSELAVFSHLGFLGLCLCVYLYMYTKLPLCKNTGDRKKFYTCCPWSHNCRKHLGIQKQNKMQNCGKISWKKTMGGWYCLRSLTKTMKKMCPALSLCLAFPCQTWGCVKCSLPEDISCIFTSELEVDLLWFARKLTFSIYQNLLLLLIPCFSSPS